MSKKALIRGVLSFLREMSKLVSEGGDTSPLGGELGRGWVGAQYGMRSKIEVSVRLFCVCVCWARKTTILLYTDPVPVNRQRKSDHVRILGRAESGVWL